MDIRTARFVTSAGGPGQFPADALPQIALAGRSNVGKSSLINMLLGKQGLAKTSQAPGKTRLINFFLVNEGPGAFYLVDVPGFGYARAPGPEKKKMEAALEGYFRNNPRLSGLVYLVDIRVPDSPVDAEALGWLSGFGFPLLVAATKADKLGKQACARALEEIRALRGLPEPPLLTSSRMGTGRKELLEQVGILLESASR